MDTSKTFEVVDIHMKEKWSLPLKQGLVGDSYVRIRVSITRPLILILDLGMSLPKMFHLFIAWS